MVDIDKYPMLKKEQQARENGSQEIGAFLEWLNSQDVHLMRWDVHDEWRACTSWPDQRATTAHDLRQLERELVGKDPSAIPDPASLPHPTSCRCGGTGTVLVSRREDWVPAGRGIKAWLCRYFDIDEDQLERERTMLLGDVREAQGMTRDGARRG